MHGDVTPSKAIKSAIPLRVMGLVGFLLAAAVNAHAAPGDQFVLLLKDVPPPNSTKPIDFDPDFVDRPANAKPHVPDGFEISHFASALRHPRSLAVAPDVDVFVVGEGQPTALANSAAASACRLHTRSFAVACLWACPYVPPIIRRLCA